MSLEPLSPPAVEDPPSERRPGAARFLRTAVSAWLVIHLTAIIVAPAAVGPSSDLVQAAWNVFHPSLQILYLNHGYHFFAPEPDESTLLAYEAARPDDAVARGHLPDRSIAPRLLYHRYFMLTEHMRDAPEELQDIWYRSYAEEIARETGATLVRLTRQTHLLPSMERIRNGGQLTDAEGYEDYPLGEFPCDGF